MREPAGDDETGTAAARAEGYPAGSASTEIDDLRFELLRNALYNDDRQAHFEFANRFVIFCTIVLGAGAFTEIAGAMTERIAAFVVVVLNAFALVRDLGGKARDHGELRARYYRLLSELDAGDIADIRRQMTLAYADEPALFHAVNALAHNRAGRSLHGENFRRPVTVGWFSRVTRNYWRHEGTQFPDAV